MIKEATILDLSEIETLVDEYEGYHSHAFIRQCLLDDKTFVFFSSELKTALFYIPQSRGRVEMHIYSKGRGGREMRNWAISTGAYVFEKDKEAKHLINWVAKDNKGLQMFMGLLGSTRVGELQDDILYCINHSDKDKIIERIK